MKYTVVTSPVADHQLAKIWLDATDRQGVADAFDRIECQLKYQPLKCGEEHPNGWRGIILQPLAVTFRISEEDRLVRIMSVYFRS